MGEENKDRSRAYTPSLYVFVFLAKICQESVMLFKHFLDNVPLFYISSWSVSLMLTYLGDRFHNI